eukprot:CAMPEP_0183431018 /NCGR_PEP_ID=MMETSP0370-20130417/54536_1 /TAXON_ID=268820 /ORGANISM="Peridinium aciculiferum, Strain PAER-2" /LENGTH=150 /DNA_ID=CAMNT_0025616577 /DNA_START=70 /DNA_END=522 /DNA_ORIENTATION=-
MGAEQSLQQCKSDCKCEELRSAYCEGNGDVVQDKAMEVVDVTSLMDPRSAEKGVRQTRQFNVELIRIGDHWRTLGLLVSPDDNPEYLIVDDIWEPSLVSEWNVANESTGLEIKPGDIIMSVNGDSNSGEDMLAKIQASGKGSTLKLCLQG